MRYEGKGFKVLNRSFVFSSSKSDRVAYPSAADVTMSASMLSPFSSSMPTARRPLAMMRFRPLGFDRRALDAPWVNCHGRFLPVAVFQIA
jgi:hypothetical protein